MIYLLSVMPEGFEELDLPEGKNYIDLKQERVWRYVGKDLQSVTVSDLIARKAVVNPFCRI